jgi:ferredoxin-NADP reductase
MERLEPTCGNTFGWTMFSGQLAARKLHSAIGERPVVLVSAGGVTPVLAMLHTLAAARSTRQVLWLHAARDRQHHPFAAEVRRLMLALTHGRSYVCYSKPGPRTRWVRISMPPVTCRGRFRRRPRPRQRRSTSAGRLASWRNGALTDLGLESEQIHIEIFNE